MQHLLRAALFAGLAGLTACGSGDQEPATDQASDSAESPSPEVIVQVNGSPITQQDVDLAIERTFSDSADVSADDRLRDKVLDSLVSSRAMRQAAESALSEDEVGHIKRMARAYEEELFVKAYLKGQVEPEPVTSAMVERYYRENSERFGGEIVRDFEWLRAPRDLEEGERDQLLNAVSTIRNSDDWQARRAEWKGQYGLTYQRIEDSQAGLLEPPLETALEGLSEGETSDVFYIDGQFNLVRLNKVQKSPPKPLSEVSGEIRQTLAPLQMKKAVRAASEKARKDAKIEYREQESAPSASTD